MAESARFVDSGLVLVTLLSRRITLRVPHGLHREPSRLSSKALEVRPLSQGEKISRRRASCSYLTMSPRLSCLASFVL
jgi:hypothetical protein